MVHNKKIPTEAIPSKQQNSPWWSFRGAEVVLTLEPVHSVVCRLYALIAFSAQTPPPPYQNSDRDLKLKTTDSEFKTKVSIKKTKKIRRMSSKKTHQNAKI